MATRTKIDASTAVAAGEVSEDHAVVALTPARASRSTAAKSATGAVKATATKTAAAKSVAGKATAEKAPPRAKRATKAAADDVDNDEGSVEVADAGTTAADGASENGAKAAGIDDDDDSKTKPAESLPKGALVLSLVDDEDDVPVYSSAITGATADPVKDYLKQIGKVALLNAA